MHYFAGGAIFGSVGCEILYPAISLLFGAKYFSKIKEGMQYFAGVHYFALHRPLHHTNLVPLEVRCGDPYSVWTCIVLLEYGIWAHLDQVWLGHRDQYLVDITSSVEITIHEH